MLLELSILTAVAPTGEELGAADCARTGAILKKAARGLGAAAQMSVIARETIKASLFCVLFMGSTRTKFLIS